MFRERNEAFSPFFSLVGGCSSDGYGNQDVTKFGDETYCRWTVCGSMAFSSVSVCTKDGYKLYWDKSPMCEISFFSCLSAAEGIWAILAVVGLTF